MAKGILEYDELELRLEDLGSGSYRVSACAADGRRGRESFTVPFTDEDLDHFVHSVGLTRRRRRSSAQRLDEARSLGSQLFASLMKGEVAEIYQAAKGQAEMHDRGLRITLYLSGAPDLMRLPWEFLYKKPRFLSQSIKTPVVRSLDLPSVRRPRKVELPLRILGMVSSPLNYEPLDATEERNRLESALDRLREAGLVEIHWLERATLDELERRIAEPDEIHVLHYIGHGAYDEGTEGGILVLENDRRGSQEVTGEDFGSMLQDEDSLRLVVLNSCEGARTSHVDPFSGAASSLVEFDIPAVIAMQFEITDEAAIAFSGRLYTGLAQGFPVDAAVAQARKGIVTAHRKNEFGTPVLFLRGADARLFDIDQARSPVPAQQDAESAHDPAAPPVSDDVEAGPPTEGESPDGEGAIIAVPARAPEIAERTTEENRKLFDDHAGEFENGLYSKQRKELSNRIEGAETLLGMCRCAEPGAVARFVAVLFTSRRLIWCREAPLSSATAGVVNWRDVRSVETRVPDGLKLGLADGSTLAFTLFKGNGVHIEDDSFEFTSSGLCDRLSELAGYTQPAGAHSQSEPGSPLRDSRWKVEVTNATSTSRALRVRLIHDTHLVKYKVGLLHDPLELDGQTVVKDSRTADEGSDRLLDFEISDGDVTLPAQVRVERSDLGLIKRVSVILDGQLAYEE